MTRFFFNIRDGESYQEDQEGAEMPGLDAARDEAVLSARELVAEHVIRGKAFGSKQFEITDELGGILAVIEFRSIVKLE